MPVNNSEYTAAETKELLAKGLAGIGRVVKDPQKDIALSADGVKVRWEERHPPPAGPRPPEVKPAPVLPPITSG